MDCKYRLKDAVKRIALLFIAWFACTTTVLAARIDIVVPPDGAAHADLAGAARYALLQRDPSLQINIINAEQIEPARADLVIVVGDLLLPWSSSDANRYPATICFYVSSNRFISSVGKNPHISALFRDQPLRRQLKLAELLLSKKARFALLYNSDNPPLGLDHIDTTDSRVTAIDVRGRDNWPRTISELMVDHHALIAIDDNQLYNRDTIRSVLLTTYRHGRVVIGPSRPFVSAGSLASAYTASDQYLNQLTDMVFQYLERGQLPAAQYPQTFRVAVNKQVADSLDLKIPNEDELTERLQQSDRQLGQECSDGC